MNWSAGIRRTHRWLSVAFTVAVIANIVVMGQEAPPVWAAYLALPPLLLLLLTGMYLFVLPYTARSRGGTRSTD
ncbi:hypothetical protein LXT21_13025 [Myxococcus sp. K38C18041901]|uniref:hypothetical protein n=1 Tax=Myxococcus guangdongensis TaxID=2906760 RepID=UPI0020A710D6|nr:hypothetical protein [Myxococcus guangdongensis]MCP3059703.1 hypothetical protein [Myxococcus guangdongensis]